MEAENWYKAKEYCDKLLLLIPNDEETLKMRETIAEEIEKQEEEERKNEELKKKFLFKYEERDNMVYLTSYNAVSFTKLFIYKEQGFNFMAGIKYDVLNNGFAGELVIPRFLNGGENSAQIWYNEGYYYKATEYESFDFNLVKFHYIIRNRQDDYSFGFATSLFGGSYYYVIKRNFEYDGIKWNYWWVKPHRFYGLPLEISFSKPPFHSGLGASFIAGDTFYYLHLALDINYLEFSFGYQWLPNQYKIDDKTYDEPCGKLIFSSKLYLKRWIYFELMYLGFITKPYTISTLSIGLTLKLGSSGYYHDYDTREGWFP